jgi:hypothetical protein
MKLYHTVKGVVLEHGTSLFIIDEPWDILVNREDLAGLLSKTKPPGKSMLMRRINGWMTAIFCHP